MRVFVRAHVIRNQLLADKSLTLDEIAKSENMVPSYATCLSIPAHLKRTGKEMRIIVDDGSEPSTPDTGLVRLLVRANAIREQLLADRSLTFEDIAKSEGVVPSYATRLFRLTILAPDIVSAFLSGKQPPELTARRLMDDTRLPLDWNEQRRCLGFTSAH